jgi:hypothetical protein
MPSKRSTRFKVKHAAKQFKKQFAPKNFAMKHVTAKRPTVIGIIVVCIAGTAMLIVASSSEPTSAASMVPGQPIVAIAPINQPPTAKAVNPSTLSAKPASGQPVGAVEAEDIATIEGCLVQDTDRFRLKDTSGDNAPKGRSWKSGFLHKSSKSIDVLDEGQRLNLARHVGERVTITGILDARQLQGTSLKRVAESCN